MIGSSTRVVVVTGGSRGIGREIVFRLAADGMTVVVGYTANKDRAEEAVVAVTDGGGRAVAVLTLTLARELRGRDITVNAVAPGPTATDLFFEGHDQAAIDRLAAQAPLECLGTPTDVAAVVAFLASAALNLLHADYT